MLEVLPNIERSFNSRGYNSEKYNYIKTKSSIQFQFQRVQFREALFKSRPVAFTLFQFQRVQFRGGTGSTLTFGGNWFQFQRVQFRVLVLDIIAI